MVQILPGRVTASHRPEEKPPLRRILHAVELLRQVVDSVKQQGQNKSAATFLFPELLAFSM